MGRIILINLALLLVTAGMANGKTITVCLDGTCDYTTIQEAIDDSNDGDTVIVADGTYTGVGNKNIKFRDKPITVRSESGPENCIIDCENSGHGFLFRGGEHENSVLDGFTITNGDTSNDGGGIECYGVSPTITNCIISGNRSGQYGGGIYCQEGSPTISNCTITGNSARYYGGGIYCEGYGMGHVSRPKIINCNISGNSSGGWGFYDGGGIFCYRSDPVITNCTIRGNTSRGIYCEGASPTITNCTIIGNEEGGICFYSVTPKLTNCIISNNQGVKGGGIYFEKAGSPIITNCTIAWNMAENEGGGIFSYDDKPIYLANCILWGNSDSSGMGQLAQIYGGEPDVIFSCIQDDNPNDMNIPFDDVNNYNIDDDPIFVRDANDGGDGWGVGDNDDFGDLHLQNISPCINYGLPSFVAGPNTIDIDGQPRIMGLRVDMGADEFEKIIAVAEPNGGEIWAAGSVHEIEWSGYGAGYVDILFSADGGDNWQTIESDVNDTGSYMWEISNEIQSEQCLVSVVPSVPDPDVVCIDSGLFTIQSYEGPQGKPQAGKHPREKYGPQFGCVKWQFETEGPVTSAVTVGRSIGRNNRAYIACEDGRVYTLKVADGSLLWSYDTNSPLTSSAAVNHYGTVYVGSTDGKLYAIDKNGGLLWTHTTKGPIYSTPTVSTEGRTYACSLDGMLYALARDGSELWSLQTKGPGAVSKGSIFATPTIAADGTVYTAGLYDPNLYALNPDDGSVKWRCNFAYIIDPCDPNSGTKAGWPFTTPAVATDGTIYQTLVFDANLYAIEPEEGTIIWLTNLADPCSGWYDSNYLDIYAHADGWSKPVLAPDGTIYVSFDDPYLRAVDPDGSIKWVTKLGTVGGFTLSVGSDGLIYAASDDGRLYVVNPEGEEIARFESNDWLSHPTIAPDKTIIVSDANNMVWAITQEDCEDEPLVLDVPEEPEPNEPLINELSGKGKNKK